MIYLENEKLEDLLKGNVIVDFYADWCGPCKMLGLVLEQINNERKDIKIIKINIDKHQNLAMKYGVMSIPRIFIYKDNTIIKDITGFISKDDIIKYFNN